MFEHLCEDLPWSQRLGEVWRMRDPREREASLALRSARGNRLRKAVGWYRNHDRLHTGDPIAMADDATNAYIKARARAKTSRSSATNGRSPTPSTSASTTGSRPRMLRVWRWLGISRSAQVTLS
jgi:hypothetical protein